MKVIHVLRKPCSESTVAANVIRWGTGGLNIDATRIGTEDNLNGGAYAKHGVERHDGSENWRYRRDGSAGVYQQPTGRWPANLILQHLDGCHQTCAPGCPVASLDEQSGISISSGGRIGNKDGGGIYGGGKGLAGAYEKGDPGFGDTGGASRFFKQVSPQRNGAG